jgi:hypothetical protein
MSKRPDWTYELHVHGTKPRDLSAAALAELLQLTSSLLGSEEHLRFFKVAQGSARLQLFVQEPARQPVHLRLVKARTDLNEEVNKRLPAHKLDECLYKRGWHAEIRRRDGGQVLAFPGAKLIRQSVIERTVTQQDSLVGTVIRIGGRDDTVPMQLQLTDGSYVDVNVKGRELARQLARLIWDRDIRLNGLATWKRDSDNNWTCIGMLVESFEELSSQPLSEVLTDLRLVEGNKWHSFKDPIAEWENIRGDK